MSTFTIALVQSSFRVGDIPWNTDKVIEALGSVEADIYVFPELTLIGYPPEDLLLRPSLDARINVAIEKLASVRPDSLLVFGAPYRVKEPDSALLNCAIAITGGEIVHRHAKQSLPNYEVFDEKRYFEAGSKCDSFEFRGTKIALTVCEDIWKDQALASLGVGEAELILNLNASPFHGGKQAERIDILRQKARQYQTNIVYVNQVGGQDELVFDGGSMTVTQDGKVTIPLAPFEKGVALVQYAENTFSSDLPEKTLREHKDQHLNQRLHNYYQALVAGVRDYVGKNGFKSVVLGLSGGIDSALTLAIACDALGPEKVRAIMMPYTYTSQMSLDDAATQAKTLGVVYEVIEIKPAVSAFETMLAPLFEGASRDSTEENIQARTRGLLLMAVSNKTGAMVLTTGNKSEMSVGYATLYGDMAGGLDVLKDVPKMLVFELARFCNRSFEVIPQRVIDRPPSAELSPDQVDEDSLPAYPVLDAILERYVDLDESAETIISAGYDREEVYKVLRLVDINEYKRRQAPPGIRLSRKAFGRDRRYPITNGWKLGG